MKQLERKTEFYAAKSHKNHEDQLAYIERPDRYYTILDMLLSYEDVSVHVTDCSTHCPTQSNCPAFGTCTPYCYCPDCSCNQAKH